MAADQHVEREDDLELGNGDTLSERLDKIVLDEDDSASIEEMRERLDH